MVLSDSEEDDNLAYTRLTKKKKVVQSSLVFDQEEGIKLPNVIAIVQDNNSSEHEQKCLGVLAYFMTMSVCSHLCNCCGTFLNNFNDIIHKQENVYLEAVSNMYHYCKLMLAPNHAAKYKLQDVEQRGINACLEVIKITNNL